MLTKAAIYLDSNAGVPLRARIKDSLFERLGHLDYFPANPSSIHSHGRSAKKALAEARESICSTLGKSIDPEQLVFTSSGSEANQLAIQSVLLSSLKKGMPVHWITSTVEHDSVRQMVPWFETLGGRVSYLPLNSHGVPEVEAVTELVRNDTALVSLMWANSETGVICDVSRLTSLCRTKKVPVHIDAAQAWGKLPIDLDALGAQYVTFSGHKIGGLSGTGLLWLAKGSVATPVILGKQEKGRRGGSENMMGLISLGLAARFVDPLAWASRVTPLRDRLEKEISDRIQGTLINGAGALRVANTMNLNFEGVEGDGLVMALDLAGYSVSSGSACSSGAMEPSHVLLAMGKTKSQAMAGLRVSLVDEIHWDVLEGFVLALEKTVSKIRSRIK